jgi:hypothetical protein
MREEKKDMMTLYVDVEIEILKRSLFFLVDRDIQLHLIAILNLP